MARTRRDTVAERPSAMVASATQLRLDSDFTKAKRNNGWQKLLWDYYDTIGEYRYVVDWLGSMAGKTRLYAGRITDTGIEEATSGDAHDYVLALFGGPAAKAEVMRQLGIHFTVAGEAQILASARRTSTGELVDSGWYIAASEKLSRREVGPGKVVWTIDGVEVPTDAAFSTRVWRPHPARYSESNSSSRAVIGVLEQLRTLDLRIMAQLNSRLIGAGIFLISDQMTLPSRSEEGKAVSANTADEVMALLQEAMEAALQDQGNASSQVPIVISAPTEAIEAAKRITFWSDLDEHTKDLREETIGRLGLGLDVPPEVLKGTADSNHWAAWASDESAIKAHGEPLVASIVQALTEGLLWPYLQSMGVENYQDYVIAGDTSAMRARPNRAKEALELYAIGAISLSALLRECGFDDSDGMDEKEYQRWMLGRIAGGSATPDQVQGALALLGVELPLLPADAGEPRETRPSPSLREFPVEGPPDRELSERTKIARDRRQISASAEEDPLHWACKMVLYRALERAGNRIRNRTGKVDGVTAADHYQVSGTAGISTDHLLDDAWGPLVGMASRFNVKLVSLQANLAAYAVELLKSKEPIEDARLSEYLAQVERV